MLKSQTMEVTLNLPENIYQNFTRLAEKKHRRVEEVITDKLQRGAINNGEKSEFYRGVLRRFGSFQIVGRSD
jgi:hypothetical protein